MTRRINYSLVLVPLMTVLMLVSAQPAEISSNSHSHHQQQQQQQPFHPMLVDTKYWIKSLDLGERSNWLNEIKPCTLFERIKLDEQAVVSMSESIDSTIEANIKDLMLPVNGMLLLEEEAHDDPIDKLLVQYLNPNSDCIDTAQQKSDDHVFSFQPDSDDLSWFNPNNWLSETVEEEKLHEWIPESHSIPCGEDIVAFGDKQFTLTSTLETNVNHSKISSFKINFAPSERLQRAKELANIKINNIRVSRLRIGNQYYDQENFEQLIRSEQYENILFDFNNTLNILTQQEGFSYPAHPMLIIDESSVRIDSGAHYCLDEAGCLCGNEDENIMKAICSFNSPIEDSEQPCYDPITSTGYCNKICASVISISMNPNSFSEPYISDMLSKLIGENIYQEVFVGARRISDNKYEISLRPFFNDIESYNSIIGKELDLAKEIIEKLNNPAISSFYGIKSVVVKSSLNWRQNNRTLVFWMSLLAITMASGLVFIYQSFIDDNKFESRSIAFEPLAHASSRFKSYIMSGSQAGDDGRTDSFVSYSDPLIDEAEIISDTPIEDGSSPLVELDSLS